MSRHKRSSKVSDKAELRAAGLRAISLTLDLGNSLTLNLFIAAIEEVWAKIEAYNTALSIINSAKTEVQQLEKSLGDLTEKMLIGVAFKYGKDSREYAMAGGVLKSECIRRRAKSRVQSGPEQNESLSSARYSRTSI